MRSTKLYLLILATFFLGRLSSERLPAIAQTATDRADLNGDGQTDTSDALYLLNWLFQGGPAPVVFAGTTDDSALIADLENRVAALEARQPIPGPAGPEGPRGPRGEPGITDPEHLEILSHMSIAESPSLGGPPAKTIRFTGVNVQIVNGLGATNGNETDTYQVKRAKINGLGNLIVGYDEPRYEEDQSPPWEVYPTYNKTGSHNLVVGPAHRYASVGAIVAGHRNTTNEPFTSVLGGSENSAQARHSVVLGGFGNYSNGRWSTVSGGSDNTAVQERSSIAGGRDNVTSGGEEFSFIGGGIANHALGQATTIVGSCGITKETGSCP